MAAPEQQSLEARLHELGEIARKKISKYPAVREGQAKDLEAGLEQDFSGMRRVIRDLESLAEEQEEEDEEEIVQRLQQYKRLLQGLQVELSTAKLQPKGDSYQENRKQLLAGADPTQRQRELQTEADMVGAAQKTTSSLQRSRQVMLQQIENQQNVLAAMDGSHEQLAKTTEEYQSQSSVYGNTRQLLRTMKRHSSWDKLILYGGFAMFMLVCLYIVQKRSVYFVPTFIKTGLGKLVPGWSRLSGRDVDQLVKPVKERQQAPEGLRQKPNLDTLRNADQAAELLQRHPVPAASSAQLGSPHPIAGDTATGQAARPHTTNMQTDQHGKADKPPDTIAQPCSQSGRPSDLQAQALASAVGATEKVVQQLSAQEQEDVRSAVAAAAQQVAQQQEQQAAMMNAGQPYPQAQFGMLMEPQNTSMPVPNSSHATLSEVDGAAELTTINADEADKLQLQEPNPVLEGSLPRNLSHELQAKDAVTVTEEQSEGSSSVNDSTLSDTSGSSKASGAAQESKSNSSEALHAASKQTAFSAPSSDDAQSSHLAESTVDATSHQQQGVNDMVTGHRSQPVTVASEANVTGAAQPQSSTGFTTDAQTSNLSEGTADATSHQQQGVDGATLRHSSQPITVASEANVTGAAQPQSSTGFSTGAQKSEPDNVTIPKGESSSAASTNSAVEPSAAVVNQTLFEQELAALTESVRNKSQSAPKLSLHSQDANNQRQHQQQKTGQGSGRMQDDGDDALLQPGTPDRGIDERMRQSGHAEAFEHIMQSIPDFIRDADSGSGVPDKSEQDVNDHNVADHELLGEAPVSASQTTSNESSAVGNYAVR